MLQLSDPKKTGAPANKNAAVAEAAAKGAKDAKDATGGPEVVPADTKVWLCGAMCPVMTQIRA